MASALDYAIYTSLANQHGPSFFLLDSRKLRANYRTLYAAFASYYPNIQIGYSYKTNYIPKICRILQDEGAWAEVVSEMEYFAAIKLGTPGDRIIFNGPYKSEWAFRSAALAGAILNLDSQRDLDLLVSVAHQASSSCAIRVVLRVNFPVDDITVSRFGFDIESQSFVDAVNIVSSLPNVRFIGLHCHFPFRDLDSFRIRAENLVTLCKRIFPAKPPEILNIGGGFYSSLPDTISSRMDVSPPSFTDYGALVGQIFSQAFPQPSDFPTLVLEPGTALVADVMDFYTQVISTKTIRGHNFATVAGSIYDISPNAKIRYLPVTPILNPEISRGPAKNFQIAGFTCIEGDVLTESLTAPLCSSDVLAYGNVGSYSVVMRPPFILPSNPILMKATDGNSFELIKSRQANEDVFALFDPQ